MILELNDDEYGHNLTLGGVMHRIEMMEASGYPLMMVVNHDHTALLDQDDVDALYAFLERYVSVKVES